MGLGLVFFCFFMTVVLKISALFWSICDPCRHFHSVKNSIPLPLVSSPNGICRFSTHSPKQLCVPVCFTQTTCLLPRGLLSPTNMCRKYTERFPKFGGKKPTQMKPHRFLQVCCNSKCLTCTSNKSRVGLIHKNNPLWCIMGYVVLSTFGGHLILETESQAVSPSAALKAFHLCSH